MSRTRRILHLDIDSFLAAVEQQADPALAGRPVAVGTGVVASCSREAKAAGVRAVMSLKEAARLCPALVILPGDAARAARYRDKVEEALRRHAPRVERASLDDFYADLSGVRTPPRGVAEAIRRDAAAASGLSVSQGIGATRTVARLATARATPGGIHEVPPGEEERFLAPLPVASLPGVGRRTDAFLERLGVTRVDGLRALGRETLAGLLGLKGERLWLAAWGRDAGGVCERRAARQVSRETSLEEPSADPDLLEGLLAWLLDRALAAVRARGERIGRLEVVVRYADNQFVARGAAVAPPADTYARLAPLALETLYRIWTRRLLLRGVGVRLARLVPAGGVQDGLWDPGPGRRAALERALARVRGRHGFGALLRGREVLLLGRVPEGPDGFRMRTPSLSL